MPIGEDGDSFLGDFVPADEKDNPEVILDRMTMRSDIFEVLDTLSPREEKVIIMRNGLDGNGQRTLEEIGKEFNVTRERIRQIEAKAMRKLRHPSRSNKLRDYLNDIA
jgi:RNA polymerase primary sigma factor